MRKSSICLMILAILLSMAISGTGAATTTTVRTAPFDDGQTCFSASASIRNCMADQTALAGILTVGGLESGDVRPKKDLAFARISMPLAIGVTFSATADIEGNFVSGGEICLELKEQSGSNWLLDDSDCLTSGSTLRQLTLTHELVTGRSYVLDVALYAPGPLVAASFRVKSVTHTVVSVQPAGPASILVASPAAFGPPLLVVKPGATVVFKSIDPVAMHSFTTSTGLCLSGSNVPSACDFNVAPLATVQIYFHDNAPPGVYDFFCSFHPWMLGKVVVRQP